MNLTDFLMGTTGKMISYSNVIVILLLMLTVSLRLLYNRRKKAYVSISLSLVFLIIQYCVLVAFLVENDTMTVTKAYVMQALQVIGYLFIHRGLYQLYNRSRRKDMAVFVITMAIMVAISIVFYPDTPLVIVNENNAFMQFVVMDFYTLLLIFVSFLIFPQYIGQTGKYLTALVAFLLFQVSGMMDRYIYEEPNMLLSITENVMPVIFYAFIFLFLFERIVEIMYAVYRSSIKDGLTNLYNRNYLFNHVKQCLNKNMKISVLFTDIDNFKKLNDTQGHHQGDLALKQVASILNEESEGIGIAARYGGEELVMLITDSTVNMKKLAERVRSRVEKETNVTISVGYSTSKKHINPHVLIKQADEAMYVSKTTGKNKVTAYRAQMTKT